jgi:hypothetical protein
LWNDRDNGCTPGKVGQCRNVRDDCHSEPLFPRAPIERIILGVKGLRNEDEAICAFLQACRIVGVVTRIDDIAFQSIGLSKNLDRRGGRFLGLGECIHGLKKGEEEEGRKKRKEGW